MRIRYDSSRRTGEYLQQNLSPRKSKKSNMHWKTAGQMDGRKFKGVSTHVVKLSIRWDKL